MATKYVSNRRLASELSNRGLVPPGCRLLEIVVTPDGALVIRYEVFVTGDQLAAVAEALQAVAEHYRQLDADPSTD